LGGAKIRSGFEMRDTLKRGLGRRHIPSRLFAICPQKTYVESTIDTAEFWKSKEAGVAFSDMYQESKFVLKNYFDPNSERIEVVLVEPGNRRIVFDF
jgi:hypothetical protein